jgi:hypothetical protein
VPLSRELPGRYLELAREAGYALRAEIALQKASRLTLPAFRSTETHIIVANYRSSPSYPSAKLLRGEFTAEQIRTHQRISKQLLIVTQVTEQVLYGNLASRLRICPGHVVPLVRPASFKAANFSF